ncbi:uncharacterized protein LOC117103962 [Anneissia japonica]|uniref:uncharacterized protein LOC117103962 n=1 Tax=Anneissia japonica TaxID=1529436 RepID=UPI00142564C4|nr:uncharacterized protein LOC117103962 [Anneissia japonica]
MKMNPPPEKDPTPPPLGEQQGIFPDGVPLEETIVTPPEGVDTSPLDEKVVAIPRDVAREQFDKMPVACQKVSFTPEFGEKPMAPPEIYKPPNLNGTPNMNFSPGDILNKNFASNHKPYESEGDELAMKHDLPRPSSRSSFSSERSDSFEVLSEPDDVQASTYEGPTSCDYQEILAFVQSKIIVKNNPSSPPLEEESAPSVCHPPVNDSLSATRQNDSSASNQKPRGIEYTSKEGDRFAGTHFSPRPSSRSSCENIPPEVTQDFEAVSTYSDSGGCSDSFEDISKPDDVQAPTEFEPSYCDNIQACEESAIPPSVYYPPVNDSLSTTKEGVPKAEFSAAELQKKLDSGYGSSKKSTGAFESKESERDALLPSTILKESNREFLTTGSSLGTFDDKIQPDDSAHSEISDSDSIEIISNSDFAERPNTDREDIEDLGQFSRQVLRTTNFPYYEMYATGGQNLKIVLKNGEIYQTFCYVYSKDISWQLDLEYGFKGEEGEGYGPTKEAFTRFYEEGKDLVYDGYGEMVPRKCDKWKIVAQILYHQFKLTKRFPLFLCRALISEMLTGRDIREYDQQCLLKSFCNTKVINNKIIFLSAINDGLENMLPEDQETLFRGIREELTAANFEHKSINAENWREILLILAHLVLIENSSSVVHEFQKCMRKDNCEFYSVDEAKQIINELNPTANAIIGKIEIPSNLSEKENNILRFLFQFISSYCQSSENAERLMLYCTSSTTLPFEPIKIDFNSVNGLMRAVTASTCDNLLHIPNTYEDQRKFEEEFINTLQSNESFVFSYN